MLIIQRRLLSLIDHNVSVVKHISNLYCNVWYVPDCLVTLNILSLVGQKIKDTFHVCIISHEDSKQPLFRGTYLLSHVLYIRLDSRFIFLNLVL